MCQKNMNRLWYLVSFFRLDKGRKVSLEVSLKRPFQLQKVPFSRLDFRFKNDFQGLRKKWFFGTSTVLVCISSTSKRDQIKSRKGGNKMKNQHKPPALAKKTHVLSSLKSAGAILGKLLKPEATLTLEEWEKLESKPTRKKEIHLQRWQ